MVIENEVAPFGSWILDAFLLWLVVVGGVSAGIVLLCYIWTTVQRGPVAAAERVYDQIVGGLKDLVLMSPRRVFALAYLAFQESIRRRVLAVVVVFLLLVLFAPWYLDEASPDPGKLYLGFVLNAANFLIWPLAIFLSVFSLPTDITKRTIYTIVTKPVRASEIVLGRILGFTAVGTLLLALICPISYLFVTRELDHSHTINPTEFVDLTPAPGDENPFVKRGRTSFEYGHRHQVFIRKDGSGETDIVQGHWHVVTSEQVDGKTEYRVGPPQGLLTARVPVYGELKYLDRNGAESLTAENVGNEWTYQQFIEGGTLAAAVWSFQGLAESQFPNGLPLQMTLGVFRTHKGQIDRPVLGAITLVNPKTGIRSAPINFPSKEFSIDSHSVPRTLNDEAGNPIDLFKDLVADGRLQIHISCVESGQYFGAAKPDLYLLEREAAFPQNFVKGYFGLWLQMVLLIAVGVMFSTRLNAAVSMIATLFVAVFGLLTERIAGLLGPEAEGGLTFESIVRMVTHAPMTTEMDPGISTTIIKVLDSFVFVAIQVMLKVVPDLSAFSVDNYVASGFNIPGNNIITYIFVAAAYLGPIFVAGLYMLRLREVAK